MVFSSLVFLYLFLPLNLIFYFVSKNNIYKNLVLLCSSLLFYAWGQPFYVLLLIISSLINYYLAILIDKNKENSKSKLFLILAVFFDLGLLAYFKYYNFFVENVNLVFSTNLTLSKVGLPIGISFFTFKIITYVVDVYKKEVQVQKSFNKLLLYVSLYHQIMSGPISKYKDIENALENREIDASGFSYGINRFMAGLFKKVLIANSVGAASAVFLESNLNEISILGAWLGIIMYTLQIYFDFSGYSDMAIGLGKMFGFTYKENFNYPYIAKNAQDFWRRWHISLSQFFRDYVYIPLGGNRKYYLRNIFIVWMLTGLWHGSSYNFIMWGLYYGVFLLLEKYFLGKILNKLPRFISHIYLILVVIIGWTFFYFLDISEAFDFIKILFGFTSNPLYDVKFEVEFYNNVILLVVGILASTPIFKIIFEKLDEKLNNNKAVNILHGLINATILIICTIMLVGQTFTPFLYFKF